MRYLKKSSGLNRIVGIQAPRARNAVVTLTMIMVKKVSSRHYLNHVCERRGLCQSGHDEEYAEIECLQRGHSVEEVEFPRTSFVPSPGISRQFVQHRRKSSHSWNPDKPRWTVYPVGFLSIVDSVCKTHFPRQGSGLCGRG